MRLWTLHPRYLDTKGLSALWREGLLAQAVLMGRTRGYRAHPQLARFRQSPDPLAAIGGYLQEVLAEGRRRGFAFDQGRVSPCRKMARLVATRGQLEYEWEHLLSKLKERDPGRYAQLRKMSRPRPHPAFVLVAGEVEPFEKRRGRS